jgi:hypothetical protein
MKVWETRTPAIMNIRNTGFAFAEALRKIDGQKGKEHPKADVHQRFPKKPDL